MSSTVKRFILLGESGAGKSTFVNIFYNYCYGTQNPDEIFGDDQNKVLLAIPCKDWLDRIHSNETSSERDINDQSKSQTRSCTSYMLHFDNVTVELIDTPGLNDADGVAQDEMILNEIENILQKISYLNGIIIVANGTVARLGTPFLHFMQMLHQIWPNNLMQNMCAILTNCDEMSCNLRSEVLLTQLEVEKRAIFYLQNSLFTWDRKVRTNKTIRNLRRDFEDTTDFLEKLLPVLVQFDNVSTDTFKISSMIQNDIQECVAISIQEMVKILKVSREQRVVAEGLNGAEVTMAANTKWHKEANIIAFKWMEVEPVSQRSPSSINGSFTRQNDDRMVLPNFESNNSQHHASNHAEPRMNNVPADRGADAKVSSEYAFDSKRTDLHGHTDLNAPTLRTAHGKRNSHSFQSQNSDTKMLTFGSEGETFGTRDDSNSASIGSEKLQLGRSLDTCVDNRKNNCQFDARVSSTQQRNRYDDRIYRHPEHKPPKEYQRQSVRLQIALDDNVARSRHEAARQEAKWLRGKAVQFAKQHERLIDSMCSLLKNLEIDVQKIRELNTDIDLLEKNKIFLYQLRDEIQVWADEPGVIECYDAVVRILSKPTQNHTKS